jgi:hypothetical protein
MQRSANDNASTHQTEAKACAVSTEPNGKAGKKKGGKEFKGGKKKRPQDPTTNQGV